MTLQPTIIAASIGTTVLLTVAGSGAQQLSTDEQRAFDAVDSAARALGSASAGLGSADDGSHYRMLSAAREVLDRIDNAVETLNTATNRYSADDDFHEAVREFQDGCEEGLVCPEVIEALAALSIANIAYAEGSGVSVDAIEAGDRTERIQRLADLAGDLEGHEDGVDELSTAIRAEFDAIWSFHELATSADLAVRSLALGVIDRALPTIVTAAEQLTDGNYTRAAELVFTTENLKRLLSTPLENWGPRTPVHVAAHQTVQSMQRYIELAEREARQYDEWVSAVDLLVLEAEEQASEIEREGPEARQDITPGINPVVTPCGMSRARIGRHVDLVQKLTFAGWRPAVVPVDDGDQMWDEVRGRLEQFIERVDAICLAGGPPEQGGR